MTFEPGDYLLRDAAWSFGLDVFRDSKEFVKEFIDYNEAVREIEFKSEVVCPFKKITIVHRPLIIVTKRFTLKTNNEKGFTDLELMYNLNRRMAPRLMHSDRRYFEGLRFLRTKKNGTHVFQLVLGS